ncbi:MAG: 50S ribosomal protein L24 [bacterium]|nr:50S ribosomal protein L24 [bacterium]
MKFKVNDQVIVTSGKDKGKKSKITRVLPRKNQVVVVGANMYTKHVRKMQGKAGEIVQLERPLATAKIAIINDKGEADRIGYIIEDGVKKRIFKKTKTVIKESKQ